MKTLKNKAGYLERKNFEEMYFSSLNWLSEVIFFGDEQQFFKDALSNYTSAVLEAKKLEEVRKIVSRISDLEKEQDVLLKQIKKHKKDLQKFMELKNIKEENLFRNEHITLFFSLHKFKKDFRKLKKDIFQILNLVLKSQKQKRLLGPK